MTNSKKSVVPVIDSDDIGYNTTSNPHFNSILEQRVSRRNMLRGGAAGAASVVFGSLGLAACGGSNTDASVITNPDAGNTAPLLGFTAVAKSLADVVSVPVGYTASVLYALGDPLNADIAAYKNDGTDAQFESRAGDHHDGMEFFGLSSDGLPSSSSVERGLLAMNHEATTNDGFPSFFLHANGGTTTLPRPTSEIDKEVDIHGISIVEVRKNGSKWEYVQNFTFNRRLTPLTPVDMSGPVRGNSLLFTKFAPQGLTTRGTLNNCGTGKTPWGTLVSGEENWNGYFMRKDGDDAARADKSVVALKRYGRLQNSKSRHGWESGGSDDKYARWDISKSGASASDDYRNEMNGMGYIIEVDPYNNRTAKKRTALGRYAHESAAFGNRIVGQKLAVYMGDDSKNEYIYKFVSAKAWVAADANPSDRLATGSSYLDFGKLYVAKFNVDGKGEWVELSINNSLIANFATYKFADQADVLVNARLAADAVIATKMDRPEWCSVNPVNGEVYYTLTNNSNRRVDASGSSQSVPDSANPRAYTDDKAGVTSSSGNQNGHILRLKEDAAGATASSFTWDIYLFGAEAGSDPSRVNLSSLTNDQDFSSPDGIAFTPTTGICWIQTDDGAYTDVTNCMMLAGLPGQVGDGAPVTLNYTKADNSTLTVVTPVGATPTASKLKRFLVGPVGSEITGLCETPDGKALFVNIQHPGESTSPDDIADSAKYTSLWPSNAGYGVGKRPRSATIVITKNDGGRIGS